MAGEYDKDFERLMSFTRSPVDDRTLAIVLISYCEKYVGEFIKYRMPGLNHDLTVKLFKSDGLLGPAIARYDMAKALGSVTPAIHADLKTLASIRNRFAHRLEVDSFEHPEIVDLISKLKTTPKMSGTGKIADGWDAQTSRVKFETIGMMLAIELHNTFNRITKAAKGG